MIETSVPLDTREKIDDFFDLKIDGLLPLCAEENVTAYYILDGSKRHQRIVVKGRDIEPLLLQIITMLSKNCPVRIIPSAALLAFDEVADTLNMTPNCLDKLRSKGAIEFSRHGLNYAVEAEKVFKLKEELDRESALAFDEVIGMDQEMYVYDK